MRVFSNAQTVVGDCRMLEFGRREVRHPWPESELGTAMMLVLLIVVLVLLFGGGGLYYGRGAGWGTPHYGGGLLGLVVILLVILWLTGNLVGGSMMR